MDFDEVIRGKRLTTFDISPDGSRFCMNVADETGCHRGLSLPAECLVQLIMTLPEMASKALRTRYRDNSLRIVYPLGAMVWRPLTSKKSPFLRWRRRMNSRCPLA